MKLAIYCFARGNSGNEEETCISKKKEDADTPL